MSKHSTYRHVIPRTTSFGFGLVPYLGNTQLEPELWAVVMVEDGAE